jgi:hypothetical protein
MSAAQFDYNRNGKPVLLPIETVNTTTFQSSTTTIAKGSLVYNFTDNLLYYSNGYKYIPLVTSSPGTITTLLPFNIIKSGNQTITTTSPTQLTNFSVALNPSLQTTPQWNLATGVFMADRSLSLDVSAEITWDPLNIGLRTLSILKNGVVLSTVTDQPAASDVVPFTQTTRAVLKLALNDQVVVMVQKTNSGSLNIQSGVQSKITGMVGY